MSLSKYNAVRTVIDGITFDSKLEASHYMQLKLLERAGEIEKLNMQTRWPLRIGGRLGVSEVVIGHYTSDFDYIDVPTQKYVVVDCKGMRLPMYLWKKKHFEAQYGMKITEVPERKRKVRRKKVAA